MKEIVIKHIHKYAYIDEEGRHLTFPRTVKTKTELEISGETEDEIFRRYEKMQNQMKYCNDTYYSWKSEATKARHKAWYDALSHDAKFALYYGGGIVD